MTSKHTIELVASTGRLSLAADEHGWTQLVLNQKGASRALGAEQLKGIATKLVSFLAQPSPGMRWVLSLSELHASIYGKHLTEGILLQIQDAEATLIGELEVSPVQRDQWIEALRPFANIPTR